MRLWRTSHTGGHRFAPTFIVLPFATLWAWADPLLLRRVVAQEGPVADVANDSVLPDGWPALGLTGIAVPG